MKALALAGFDRPPAVMDVPAPTPASGEVLVRVQAASVNAYDIAVAMGMMKDYLPYEFPAVIGGDLAGDVESVGPDVEGFVAGDRVFGMLGMKGSVRDGTFAERATPQAVSIVHTPDDVDDLQAGSLGVAGTTAASAVDTIDPEKGATVLIVGATGGVGSFAIQLAAARGAHVIASVRSGDEDFVKELGAAETVDYMGDLTADVGERFADGLDAVIDLVNRDPAGFASLASLVRDGGRAVSAVGGAGEASSIGEVGVANIGGDPSRLAALADLVRQGRLAAAIRRAYPFEDAAKALEDFTNGHTLGKLVIRMWE